MQNGAFAQHVINISMSSSWTVLIIMNGVGIPGRIIPAILADTMIGPTWMLVLVTFFSSTLLFFWMMVDNIDGFWLFIVLYGGISSGIQSLFPAAVASLSDNPERGGVQMGMVFSIAGIASLLGAPLAGKLIESSGGKFMTAQIFAGVTIATGCLTLVVGQGLNCRNRRKALLLHDLGSE